MRLLQEHFRLLPFYLFFCVLTFLSKDHIFFWDTVQLGSMQAHHFFENGLSKTLLPDQIDSGHIPSFGMYLAFWWKIFGKTLAVSHIAMLPFLIGIVWQLHQLLKHFLPHQFTYLALVLLIADPTLLGQSVLVSPDVVLVFFFLISLNGIIRHKRILIAFGIAGLFLISMRGLMVAFALLIFDIYLNALLTKEMKFSHLAKMSLPYWPSVLGILPYFLFHYIEKGWIGYHAGSPWMVSFERVGITGFFYNIGILGWRLLDFGRVFVFISIIFITLTRVGKIKAFDKFRNLIVLSLMLLLCLGLSFTTYKYLSAHRYILPLIICVELVFAYMLFVFVKSSIFRNVIYIVTLSGLISGNFWVYPEGMAQGWDASLAHWPYYELRENMIRYFEKQGINYSDVAAEFPNTSERKYLELTESTERHQYLDLDSNQYVLYSNIYNNIDDEEIKKLKNGYTLLKSFKKRGVFLSLYTK